MSHQPVIDALEFASAGGALRGSCRAAELARLRPLLAPEGGEVAYSLCGERDARGRPALRLEVRGTLGLVCQRCLEPLQVAVATDNLLVLAASQQEVDAEPDAMHAPDRVVARKDTRVLELVEDELILELPYAPRHERCGTAAAAADAVHSPFAGLRALMRGRH